MPVIVINPKNRISFPYTFPSTGKIKIYVEASQSVDVFIARSSSVSKITSVNAAKQAGIYTLEGQLKVDNLVLTLPQEWSKPNAGLSTNGTPSPTVGTWDIVIGNPSDNHVGVYYMVYNA